MTIELQLWHLITLLTMFIGAAWAGFGVLLQQVDRRLETRFSGLEMARDAAQRNTDAQLAALADQSRREVSAWQALERDFLNWKADLPIQYVRREDYVRNQTVIEAKLDGLRLSIENQYLKGGHHD
ncbi:MAG: hypothetical protein Q8O33_12855 [Pseudomonadota bacterium]|nr:hypothetical protein [Pseudomonadota bacterium]